MFNPIKKICQWASTISTSNNKQTGINGISQRLWFQLCGNRDNDIRKGKKATKMTLHKGHFFKFRKTKKMCFFLMSQGSFSPKISFLGQKVCSVARAQTDRQTREWKQRTPFQGFRIVFKFSFNLSSRSGPIMTPHVSTTLHYMATFFAKPCNYHFL